MLTLFNWFKTLCSGRPHFLISDQADPYLHRWYVIPRNRFLNLYLHKFLRDDEDRALHDHRSLQRAQPQGVDWRVGCLIQN